MMVDDDDVAFDRPAMHLGNKAALPLFALLAGAAVGTSVELLPQLIVFRQSGKLGAIAGFGLALPLRDLPVVLDFFQAAEHRLVGKVIKLLPAQIIIAAFHVTNPQLAQVLLEEWDILKEKLLLQVF